MNFEELDDVRLAEAREEWLSQADAHSMEVSQFDYVAILNQLRDHHSETAHASVWAVIDDEKASTVALTVLQHAQPGSDSPWLKMLYIYLQPDLDVAAGNDEADLKQLARIASVAVVGAYDATFKAYPSNTLKVMGRNPLDARFLGGVLGENQALANAGIEVKERGAWIFLEKPLGHKS